MIITTKNVSYLSADPSDTQRPSPQGLWTVANVMGDDLLITKGKISVVIPSSDVLLHSKYSLDKFLDNLKRDIKSGEEDS